MRTAEPDVTAGNKALARKWFEEGWSRGNVEIAPQIFAPYFVLRGRTVGPAGPQESVRRIRSAFRPLQVSVERQIAEGTMLATHYTAHGKHIAEYRGIPPTGSWITVSGVQIWEVVNGRAIRDWNIFDEWSLVSQLRLAAAPAVVK